jgi:rhomboid family GlyGly-CTERM serine protease
MTNGGGRAAMLVVIAAAVSVQLSPAVAEAFLYDRVAVANGELWRLATSSLVHFSWMHLAGDALALLVGSWLLDGRPMREVIMLSFGASVASGIAVLLLAPELRWYGGLSGIAHAVVVYGALLGVREGRRRRSLSVCVLALIGVKLIVDANVTRHVTDDAIVANASHWGAIAFSVLLFTIFASARNEGRTTTRDVEGADCHTRNEEASRRSHPCALSPNEL